MGLLDNLRKSYQIKLNQDRINSGLPPLKFDREETAWEKGNWTLLVAGGLRATRNVSGNCLCPR